MSWVAITEFTVDTNGFHGTAYDFHRNQKLDSNNFFNNARAIGIPIYKQRDFRRTVSGPVVIPKLYNGKNRMFLFVAYEASRNRAGTTGSTHTVPTPEMYNGDFPKWVHSAGVTIPIYDPTSQTTKSRAPSPAPSATSTTTISSPPAAKFAPTPSSVSKATTASLTATGSRSITAATGPASSPQPSDPPTSPPVRNSDVYRVC